MGNDHTLSAMPEEILVMVFRECFAAKIFRLSIRRRIKIAKQPKQIGRRMSQTKKGRKRDLPSCMNVFLVCKTFYRIALPQLYAVATFLYRRSLYKEARFLRKPDFYHIKPQKRLRNIYCKQQPITALKIGQGSKIKILKQVNTIRLETEFHLRSNDHLKIMQELVQQCRIRNVYLEMRLQVSGDPCTTNGSNPRLCVPYFRLIVDTDGSLELVAAHMVDKDFFDLIKSKIDALFGCNLPTLEFKAGKRRIVRATDLARSRWEKFGTKF